jgi:hypothetical protein
MGTEAPKPTAGVQKHVDRLLRLYDGSDRLNAHPSFHFVTSWCEVHPDEAGLYSGDTGASFIAVNPAGEKDLFTDDELREHLSLSEATPIRNDMRVSYVLRHLEKILEGVSMDADVHPTGCTIRLLSTKGREAFLGYELRGYSFSGVQLTWFGVFDGIDDLRADFQRRGFVTSVEECRALDPRSLLALWRESDF